MTTCREQWWQPRGDLPGPAAGGSEPPPPWPHSELRGSLPSIHPAYPPSLKPADKQDLSKIICGKDCNYNFQHITHLSNIYGKDCTYNFQHITHLSNICGKDCTYSFNISMYITFDNFEVNQSCTLAAQCYWGRGFLLLLLLLQRTCSRKSFLSCMQFNTSNLIQSGSPSPSQKLKSYNTSTSKNETEFIYVCTDKEQWLCFFPNLHFHAKL